MIFRLLSSPASEEPAAAFSVFSHSQQGCSPPFGLLFQSEHSRIAGEIAALLNPEIFGPLSDAVVRAIAHHDAGWDLSDEDQLAKLAQDGPHSFTEVDAADTLPCWLRSIAHGYELGPLEGVLISRHCCLLGTGSQKHKVFIREESERRKEIERNLPFTAAQLDQWTAALGFCDLLSLYVCCGSHSAAAFALAHPEQAEERPSIIGKWSNGFLCFSRPLLRTDLSLCARGWMLNGSQMEVEPSSWRSKIVASYPH